ncbi:leucine---tRNA ligase [Chytriomyces confervae]|uniref:leucine--tRNA ligase n=1 Tax=Chytriomyces confervae TaxID=246404 RepID=A0A507EPF5_9FUNG|nr:leucine---tRNA ligase [Chytriomyces confervae]
MPSRYVLPMFPYPSGRLHMGHLRVYSIADVLARFERKNRSQPTKRIPGSSSLPNKQRICNLESHNNKVIFPIGFDSFGLPAENAAIERNVAPAEWTKLNMNAMATQLKSMGTSFDWERLVSTCDPSYYRWTQLIFLRMHQQGLVYRKQSIVNWDPVDQTVLANEQVDSEGKAERSGALVEKKKLEQWFIKITEYQNELLNGLDSLNWPTRVKQLQKNWIGREDGFQISCEIDGQNEDILVFFTNPDTVKMAEYVSIACDHPLIESSAIPCKYRPKLLQTAKDIQNSQLTPVQKAALGLFSINPVTSRRLAIYLSGAMPSEFGVGATFGGSLLDSKDAAFAKQNGIPLMEENDSIAVDFDLEPFKKTHFRLRDWLISRQRYWGTPVPMIHCSSCGIVPVPEADLPVILPENVKLSGRGGSPLASCTEWVECQCPKCKGPAKRDTDTMDTFIDSSWYWLRYLDPQNDKQICDPSLPAKHLPVTTYIGGVEHAILHLLYARFVGLFLFKSRIAPGSQDSEWNGEPFKLLLAQGMVTGQTVRCKTSGRYFKPEEIEWKDAETPIVKATGEVGAISYEKMSKSKYNGVDPSEIIEKYGSDCTRLAILYKAAPTDELMWDERGIVGMQRWLAKCQKIVTATAASEASPQIVDTSNLEKKLLFALHTAIKEVTHAMTTTFGFHVAIASLIKLTNHMDALPTSFHSHTTFKAALSELIQMASPFAPQSSQEMWANLHPSEPRTVHEIPWPAVSEAALKSDSRVCVVTVDGRKRGTVQVPVGAEKSVIEAIAWDCEEARNWLFDANTGKRVQFGKVIVVKDGAVVNFVTAKKS